VSVAPVTVDTDVKPYDVGPFDYGASVLNDLQRAYPEAIGIHNGSEDGSVVAESTGEDLPLSQVGAEFDLSTVGRADHRTRELAATTAESPPLARTRSEAPIVVGLSRRFRRA